jgi:hypothetical protein
MSSTSTQSKLAELRAKTDRELVVVIEGELERGLHLARAAEETSPVEGLGSEELPHVTAEAAYADAAKLLAIVDDLGDRQRLEWKLERLRQILNLL